MTKGFPRGRGLREWLGADDEFNAAGERVSEGRATLARRRVERLRYRNKVAYCEFLMERAIARGTGTDSGPGKGSTQC